MLTVIHAQEASAPRGRQKIDWKLITNLPVRSRKDAVENLVDKLIPGNPAKRRREATLSCYLTNIARLGG
jgi:hypothetical protein